jgi:hypothetical protein
VERAEERGGDGFLVGRLMQRSNTNGARDHRAPRNPPWDLVLAMTVVWATVTGPAFLAATILSLFLASGDTGSDLYVHVALAVPASTALGAVGALVSGLVRCRIILTITSALPCVAAAGLFIVLVIKLLT